MMPDIAREWYFFGPHKQHQGPFALAELKELFDRGRLKEKGQLWREGEKKLRTWKEVWEDREVSRISQLGDQERMRLARDQRAALRLTGQWPVEDLVGSIVKKITQESQAVELPINQQGYQNFKLESQIWDQHFVSSAISHQQQQLAKSQSLDSLYDLAKGIGHGVVGGQARALYLDTLIAPTPQRLRKLKLISLVAFFSCAVVIGLLPWESWRSQLYKNEINFPHLSSEISSRDFERLKAQAMAQAEKPQFELASDRTLSKIYLSSNYQGPLDLMVKLTSKSGEILSPVELVAYGEARFISHLAQLRDLRLSHGNALAPGVYEIEIESKDRDSEGKALFQQRKLVLLGFHSHREFLPQLEKFQKLQRSQTRALAQSLSEQWQTLYSRMRDFRRECLDILQQYPSGEMVAEKLQTHYLKNFGPFISNLAIESKGLHESHRLTHPGLSLYWLGLYDLARAQGEFWSTQWEQVAGNDVMSERLVNEHKMVWQRELMPLEERAHSRLARIDDLSQQLQDDL